MQDLAILAKGARALRRIDRAHRNTGRDLQTNGDATIEAEFLASRTHQRHQSTDLTLALEGLRLERRCRRLTPPSHSPASALQP